MKRAFIYWKTKDRERKAQLKAALGIKEVSVNGESEYKGDLKELKPYVREGLIEVRMKEYEEVRRPKIYINTKQSKPVHGKKIGCSSRKGKIREQIRTSSIFDFRVS